MLFASILLSGTMLNSPEPLKCVDEDPQYELLMSLVCDDRSMFMDRAGNINYRCSIDGYTLYDPISWPEATEICYDDLGEWDENICGEMKISTCITAFGCGITWALCPGTFVCADGAEYPCNWGECIEPGD